MIRNLCIPVKNTFGSTAVVFCACKIIQLISVVSRMVGVLYKFNVRRVLREHTSNGDQWEEINAVVASVMGLPSLWRTTAFS